jgi:hypothetical protein
VIFERLTVPDIRTTIGRFRDLRKGFFHGGGVVWKRVFRIVVIVAAPRALGSSGSGISILLPGMYRLSKAVVELAT